METTEKKKTSKTKVILMVIGGIAIIWFLFDGGLEQQAASNMQKIENQVAADFEKQYDIAKKNGTAMDAYSAAMMVSAAYLQANDEPNYKKWKEIEKQEAKAAGLPQ